MKLQHTILAIAVGLVFSTTAAHAQAQPQDPNSTSPVSPLPPMDSGSGGAYGKAPVAAARGVSPAYDPSAYDPSQVTPDTNTLSGAEPLGLGSLQRAHNTFDPSLSYSELGQTITGANGQSNLGLQTIINGNLDFDRTWSRYHFVTVYDGGGTFDRGPLPYNTQFQELAVSQQIDWARWHLLLRDDFTASPGASFTGTGMGGPGLIAETSSAAGDSLNGTQQAFVPNETIQTGNAMRYRDAALAQMEYSFSRRSAFTFSGSYGLLHFTDSGYVNSHNWNAQAGYDYQLDPANSIALLGSYGKIDYTYTGPAGSTTDYTAQFAYGRKLTGRLAFQLAAGPQQIRSSGGTGGDFELWVGSVNTGLIYERRRSGVSFSYARGLSSGAGVLLGANSNTFTGGGHYLFTRFWTGTVSGGYALNQSLVPAGSVSTNFDNWFVGANMGRQVGRFALVNFNYGVQRQSSGSSACPVIICGGTALQQSFGMTLNLHLRPAGD